MAQDAPGGQPAREIIPDEKFMRENKDELSTHVLHVYRSLAVKAKELSGYAWIARTDQPLGNAICKDEVLPTVTELGFGECVHEL